mmetsp:Transcript_49184/g.126928  ORF Transcript_49184/g.126928 Transcript_49184/m.126928 type:complete len:237 (-) Transcript_49184:4-714(-)
MPSSSLSLLSERVATLSVFLFPFSPFCLLFLLPPDAVECARGAGGGGKSPSSESAPTLLFPPPLPPPRLERFDTAVDDLPILSPSFMLTISTSFPPSLSAVRVPRLALPLCDTAMEEVEVPSFLFCFPPFGVLAFPSTLPTSGDEPGRGSDGPSTTSPLLAAVPLSSSASLPSSFLPFFFCASSLVFFSSSSSPSPLTPFRLPFTTMSINPVRDLFRVPSVSRLNKVGPPYFASSS